MPWRHSKLRPLPTAPDVSSDSSVHLSSMHGSAWKGNYAKLAYEAFSEVREKSSKGHLRDALYVLGLVG